MDVFIKGFVALFDLLKCFPHTFKLLKKFVQCQKPPGKYDKWVKVEG